MLGTILAFKKPNQMVAIIQFNTPDIEDYARLGAAINSHYCSLHGHQYIRDVYKETVIHPPVEKLFVIQRHLRSHDWVAWIDSDACVINHRKDIADFTRTDKNLITSGHEFGFDLKGQRIRVRMGKQEAGINTGVFLLRNCAWSCDFLQCWINLCKLGSEMRTAYWEQGILQWMLIKDICELQANINLINPASRINRQDFIGTSKSDRCDFILHLWGSDAKLRASAFSAISRGTMPEIPQISMPDFCVKQSQNKI